MMQPHGTWSGWLRHSLAGEMPCDECLARRSDGPKAAPAKAPKRKPFMIVGDSVTDTGAGRLVADYGPGRTNDVLYLDL